jgi:hypothetical protein
MVDGFTDSDWAGCPKTRRSTSGGVLLHGQHLVHHWSSTQAVVALSSMEAELNAIVKGVAEVLSLKNLLAECGRTLQASIFTDSSAANGVVHRQGCGKVKHLECRQLWVQGAVLDGRIQVQKVARDFNPADAFTHYTSVHEAKRHYDAIGLVDPCIFDFVKGGSMRSPTWTTSSRIASVEGGCKHTPPQATVCYMNETLRQTIEPLPIRVWLKV